MGINLEFGKTALVMRGRLHWYEEGSRRVYRTIRSLWPWSRQETVEHDCGQ